MITETGWSLLTGPGVRSMFHETVFGDVEPMTRIRLVRGGEKSRPHATETKTHGSAWRCGTSGWRFTRSLTRLLDVPADSSAVRWGRPARSARAGKVGCS